MSKVVEKISSKDTLSRSEVLRVDDRKYQIAATIVDGLIQSFRCGIYQIDAVVQGDENIEQDTFLGNIDREGKRVILNVPDTEDAIGHLTVFNQVYEDTVSSLTK